MKTLPLFRHTLLIALASSSLTLAACGDDESPTPDAGETDTSADTSEGDAAETDTVEADVADDATVTDTVEADVAADTVETDVVEADVAADTTETDTVEGDVAEDTTETDTVEADITEDTVEDTVEDTTEDTVESRLEVNGCTYETASDMTGQSTVDISGIQAWTIPHQVCIVVSAGTEVSWSGSFGGHPLVGGEVFSVDDASPITIAANAAGSEAATVSVMLANAGDFAYFCNRHFEAMQGVIYVD